MGFELLIIDILISYQIYEFRAVILLKSTWTF
jgi:hypothetical protein